MQRKLHSSPNGTHYFCFQAEEIAPFLQLGSRRVTVRLNGKASFHAALMPRRNGEYFLTVGKRIWASLNLAVGDLVELTLGVDDAPCLGEAPEALREVLNTDPEAQSLFEQLPPERQQSLLRLVQQNSSLEEQIQQALRIADLLKRDVSLSHQFQNL